MLSPWRAPTLAFRSFTHRRPSVLPLRGSIPSPLRAAAWSSHCLRLLASLATAEPRLVSPWVASPFGGGNLTRSRWPAYPAHVNVGRNVGPDTRRGCGRRHARGSAHQLTRRRSPRPARHLKPHSWLFIALRAPMTYLPINVASSTSLSPDITVRVRPAGATTVARSLDLTGRRGLQVISSLLGVLGPRPSQPQVRHRAD